MVIFFIVNFMISIIVHLPLRGCPLKCYFSMNINVNNLQDKLKEPLFHCGGVLDMQIEWNHFLLNRPKKNQKMAKEIWYINVYC